MYLEDLLYAGLSASEFNVLKREVGLRCKFFPSVAEILECRDVFVDSVFEPTAADRQALIENPDYKYGKTTVHFNEEMVQQVAIDYEEKESIRSISTSWIKDMG